MGHGISKAWPSANRNGCEFLHSSLGVSKVGMGGSVEKGKSQHVFHP